MVDKSLNYEQLLPPGTVIDGNHDIREVIMDILTKGPLLKSGPLYNEEKLLSFVFPGDRSFAAVTARYISNERRLLVARFKVQHQQEPSAEQLRQIDELSVRDGNFRVASRIVSYLAQGHITEPINATTNYWNTLESPVLRKEEMRLRLIDFQEQSLKDHNEAIEFDPDVIRQKPIFKALISKFIRNDFNNSQQHVGSNDPRIVKVRVPWPTRYRWMRRSTYLIFRSLDYLRSREYQKGAHDYEDLETFAALVKNGTIPKKSAAEIDAMINDRSLTRKIIDRVTKWLNTKPSDDVVNLLKRARRLVGLNPEPKSAAGAPAEAPVANEAPVIRSCQDLFSTP